ncbi:MAG: hypothetical protein QQW96_14670 [Tychonema bourrellyi B0820]|uniref:Uncharacterized protein n=1 Tax=Tychonema bourrellyi FEM_GT703 TaxID=2040638 RepID=A0A2G4EVY5_9CYAN|nr:hypothetical protein [Tychonema bourrellyi B0820]PHX53693.1 hypothetical protein CP500_020170 [Tychonema bourrellyi FEM_GT703]
MLVWAGRVYETVGFDRVLLVNPPLQDFALYNNDAVDLCLYGQGGFMKLLALIENNGIARRYKTLDYITMMLPDMILLSS